MLSLHLELCSGITCTVGPLGSPTLWRGTLRLREVGRQHLVSQSPSLCGLQRAVRDGEDIPGRGTAENVTKQESVGHGVRVGVPSGKHILVMPRR